MKLQTDARRNQHAERILKNLAAILTESDELQRQIAIAREHLLLNDTFFFHHHELLTKFPDRTIPDCSDEDLVELYLDTCQFLSRLRQAGRAFETANRHLHYFDYSSAEIFDRAFREAMEDL